MFVLLVTLIREGVDDFRRRQRDKEINCQKYQRITKNQPTYIPSSSIKVTCLGYFFHVAWTEKILEYE
jgi:phospholipid-translocating ATPase